jgi:hypothetical protein
MLRSKIALAVLALGLTVPSVAAAVDIPAGGTGQQCGRLYLTACVTINSAVWVGGDYSHLQLSVTNSSTVGPTVLNSSFVAGFYFLFDPSAGSDIDVATVWINGADVNWGVGTGNQSSAGGFGIVWDDAINAGGDHRLTPGTTATIDIFFVSALADGTMIDEWTGRIRGLGADGEGSDWTQTVPEPFTVMLLGTGLAGIAGVARRRRKGLDA